MTFLIKNFLNSKSKYLNFYKFFKTDKITNINKKKWDFHLAFLSLCWLLLCHYLAKERQHRKEVLIRAVVLMTIAVRPWNVNLTNASEEIKKKVKLKFLMIFNSLFFPRCDSNTSWSPINGRCL